MAVIDTSMDMPESCYKCPKRNVCFYAQCNGWINNERDEDCPLKPIDGLITEIYKESYHEDCYGDYPSTSRVVNLEDVVKVINEYCDKEQNDK